tara:strand:+ start:1561 stop:1920 length:360 start_codon:yes stop_codon:yes gene_type:complete
MENIELVFDKSKFIAVQNNQIQLLKEIIKEKLTVGHLGGLFYINSELLNFLDLLERSGYDSAVVNDMNETPVEITNITEFKKTCMEKYAQEQNQALAEMRRIRKARTVKELVEYDYPEE